MRRVNGERVADAPRASPLSCEGVLQLAEEVERPASERCPPVEAGRRREPAPEEAGRKPHRCTGKMHVGVGQPGHQCATGAVDQDHSIGWSHLTSGSLDSVSIRLPSTRTCMFSRSFSRSPSKMFTSLISVSSGAAGSAACETPAKPSAMVSQALVMGSLSPGSLLPPH